MFNNMPDTSVVETNNEDLLAAIGDAADDKTAGKNDKTDKPDKTTGKNQGSKASAKASSKDKTATSTVKTVTDLADDDLSAALGEENDEDDDDDNDDDADAGKKNGKKKPAKAAKAADETGEDDDDNEDNDDDTDGDDDKDEDNQDDDKGEDDDEEGAEGDLTVENFLKARVGLLIQKGQWADFEGREDVEWTEENFAEMELRQREHQKEILKEEVLDSFGPIGREIAEYTANGGNPDELIDLFKEQQRVEALTIDTEDAQKAVVLKYATEYQKMKPARAQKYVDGLIADKELADTAKEAKEAMEADIEDQKEALKANQEALVKQQQAQQQANLQKFANDVNIVLNNSKDIPVEEKKQLQAVLTKFDKKLKNGQPVNEFYFKLAEFRKDLPNYIDLVRFVLNPDKFRKTVKNQGKTETAEKAFTLLRTDNKKKSAKSVDTNTGKAGGKQKPSGGFKLL